MNIYIFSFHIGRLIKVFLFIREKKSFLRKSFYKHRLNVNIYEYIRVPEHLSFILLLHIEN